MSQSESRTKGRPWPTDLRFAAAPPRELDISRPSTTAKRFTLPAEYLRVESPSAEVQGHNPDQKVTIAGRAHVGIR